MVALLARQLCLGKVGNPLNFGADHGNGIWARRGDPVAYRLVLILLLLAAHVSCDCDRVVSEGGGIFCGTGEDRSPDEVQELPRVPGSS